MSTARPTLPAACHCSRHEGVSSTDAITLPHCRRPAGPARPVPAHLRCGDTCARLAAGFRIAIATVYRYIREATDLLAPLAPTLEQAMDTVRSKAYVVLDGTLLLIDRIAADRPYRSGKKKHHGMNVQVLADPAGRLIWASDALPGVTHDLTAARTHDIPATLAADGIKCWADKAYQGASPAVRVPFRGRNPRGWRRRHNRDHAKIRSLGERAMATLKGRRLLRKLRWNDASAFVSCFPTAPRAAQGSTGSGAAFSALPLGLNR
ncbi:transposase family protein [Streptomyces sp. NPDC058625]|uniref:transposase family protein n=1 Tax=Streptomyces sp. NPDC058625 TaxID=3346564 RepID=UPI00364F7714